MHSSGAANVCSISRCCCAAVPAAIRGDTPSLPLLPHDWEADGYKTFISSTLQVYCLPTRKSNTMFLRAPRTMRRNEPHSIEEHCCTTPATLTSVCLFVSDYLSVCYLRDHPFPSLP
ncbi:hypothetical protein E2C01_067604 [Portunus trituberculatus]|uniref:Uncharacterized protein n=1 Tax=Portunus trituberculatus TaxID=210409 RepID=A0A5B7HK89_PORTR|nr:hypothetical protein [Portunus trituberculatus]